MADGTKIEWADATVNAINGCSVVSPGCTNCYAMRLAGTRLRNHPSRAGLTQPSKAGPVWNGTVRLSESALLQPLRWRAARVIFWNAHGDTFHDAVPDEWIDRMFAVMALTPQHKHLVLTKRSARMRDYLSHPVWRLRVSPLLNDLKPSALWNGNVYQGWQEIHGHGFLPNVWLGVSVEDQVRADERIPDLLATPAAGRFLSCEPLLGPIDLTRVKRFPKGYCDKEWINAIAGRMWTDQTGLPNPDPRWAYPGMPFADGDRGLDGVIVGGESGPGARPMHPEWVRSLRNQCAAAAVDFHFKQWGSWGEVPLETAAWDPPPEANLRQGKITILPNGAYMGRGFFPIDAKNAVQMDRMSKAASGRVLDGVSHDALPWRREAA